MKLAVAEANHLAACIMAALGHDAADSNAIILRTQDAAS
jgi:hypothetical protein